MLDKAETLEQRAKYKLINKLEALTAKYRLRRWNDDIQERAMQREIECCLLQLRRLHDGEDPLIVLLDS